MKSNEVYVRSHKDVKNRAVIFVKPSILSGTITLFAMVYILFVAFADQFDDVVVLREGSQIVSDRLQILSEEIDGNGIGQLLGNEFTNQVLLFLLWGAIGFLVYLLLFFLSRLLSPFIDFAKVSKYIGKRKAQSLSESSKTLAIRVTAGIVLVVYAVLFVRVLAPLLLTVLGAGSDPRQGVLLSIAAVITLALALHLFTLLIRIIALRLRVFGDQDYYQ